MKQYCLDTSGVSEPLQRTPEDLYPSLWKPIKDILASGRIAITKEIFDEMVVMDGSLGAFIKAHRQELLLEIGGNWEWQDYVQNTNGLQQQFSGFISENNNDRKGTVGMNDISIIALAQTLRLPLINMEVEINESPKKKRTPNICRDIGVVSIQFNDFLRAEGLQI